MATNVPGPLEDKEYVGSWFAVELDNGVKGNFTDISGLAIEVEVVEKVDANTDTTTRKRPGTAKFGDITLTRTLSGDQAFWAWAMSIRDGEAKYRHDGAIVLYDIAEKEIGRWTFLSAWPSKWSASDLDIGSDDMMTEEVTLAIEGLKREK